MAARGYEFYLRVLKVSLTSERSERVRDTFSTMKCLDLKQLVLFIFEMMKNCSPTTKTRMLCNMKQDMKVMKNKS